jgi:hypothetical protein
LKEGSGIQLHLDLSLLKADLVDRQLACWVKPPHDPSSSGNWKLYRNANANMPKEKFVSSFSSTNQRLRFSKAEEGANIWTMGMDLSASVNGL